jgi:hypothetical protein
VHAAAWRIGRRGIGPVHRDPRRIRFPLKRTLPGPLTAEVFCNGVQQSFFFVPDASISTSTREQLAVATAPRRDPNLRSPKQQRGNRGTFSSFAKD